MWTALILASRPVRDRSRLTSTSLAIVSARRMAATNPTTPKMTKPRTNRKAQRNRRLITGSVKNIFRPDFQAFVLILPDNRGIMFQKLGQQLAAGEAQQLLRLLRRVVVSLVVIGHALALPILPMRHRVNRRVFLGPTLHRRL